MASAGICGNKTQIFCEMFTNFFLTILCVAIEQLFKFEAENLVAGLWRNAAVELQRRFRGHAAFLEVMNPQSPHVPAVENPVQRLTELKRLFDAVSFHFTSFAFPMSQALFLLPMMFRGVGLSAPLLLALNYLAFRAAQVFAPDFARIQSVQATLESRFQVLHTRLKGIAEPVAFSGAGEAERRIIEPRFEAIMDFEQRALRKQFWYNTVLQFFTNYSHLPMWTHRLMAIRYVSRNNPSNPRGLAPANVVGNVLFDRSTQWTQVAVQRCVTLVPEWRRIDAYCVRVLETIVAFERAAETKAVGPGALSAGEEGRISVRGLDLVTRRGRCLAMGLSFEAEEGKPLLVTGPNASGKSLLASMVLGLWTAAGSCAAVEVPGASGRTPPLETIMPAPQRIYLPTGALFAQLLYPRRLDVAAELGGPPFKLLAFDFPGPVTREFLQSHFAAHGAVDCDVEGNEGARERRVRVVFASAAQALGALARPQDRRMGAAEFRVDMPRSAREGPSERVSFARMRDSLMLAGVDGILTREARGWLAERSWEDVLSGGEQQRMGLARVFYQRPRFALLDECTSMVAHDSEEGLYRCLVRDFGVTPITLSQRLFMPDVHARELRLGTADEQGWSLVDLRQPSGKDS